MTRQKVKPPSKEELQELYVKEGTSISSLARHYGTTNPTVRNWLISYEIQRKDHKRASTEANNRHRNSAIPTKTELEKLYSESSIKELERYYGVGQSTIYKWLEDYSIKLRDLGESCKLSKSKTYSDIQFSKEFLEEKYDRTKPLTELADKLNVSRSHILKLFSIHNIEKAKMEPSYRSKAEIELFEFLSDEFPDDNWEHTNRTIISPLELDIVNHTKKIAIEYCGLYWHSEGAFGKNSTYHRSKFLSCKEAGYKLITVFESDDTIKVRKFLLKILGKTKKIHARKTQLRELSSIQASEFHSKHHLHGSIGGKFHYGLFYNDELVMACSFGMNRFSKNQEYECTRMTSSDYTVVGGASKLFSHFIKTEKPASIVTFADLRFGEGKTYLNCGFVEAEQTAPNYWYFKKNTNRLFSRVKFQKHKLAKQLEDFDPDKTEYENMLDNKWDRIWDCGNAKYIWRKE